MAAVMGPQWEPVEDKREIEKSVFLTTPGAAAGFGATHPDLQWCKMIRFFVLFRCWSQGFLLLVAKDIFSAPCRHAVFDVPKGNEEPSPCWLTLDIQAQRTVAKPLGTWPELTTCSRLLEALHSFLCFSSQTIPPSQRWSWPGPRPPH